MMSLPDQYNAAVLEVRALRAKLAKSQRAADQLSAELHKTAQALAAAQAEAEALRVERADLAQLQEELGRVRRERDEVLTMAKLRDEEAMPALSQQLAELRGMQ